MKFIPTEKEKWVEECELPYNKHDLGILYDNLVLEMNQAMIVLSALGGRFDNTPADPLPVLNLSSRKYRTLQDAPDYLLGRVFKQVVAEYEDKLYDFDGLSEVPKVTIEELMSKLMIHGMEMCSLQFYYFASALEQGRQGTDVGNDIDGYLAAFRVAHELGVPLKEITPQKALEYVNKRKCE